MFLDYAKINVKSGNGGSGAVSFRREKYVPRGGPDGGDGGRGGHIIFKISADLNTLSNFRFQHHFKAENGKPGEGGRRFGKDGKDLIISVPEGTVVRDAETKQVLADLTGENQEVLFLKGGRGGRGNTRFATPTRRTPRFSEKGEPGLETWIELELKLLADVGIIGFPNAGKSTLLSKITAAKPKIADYPFTTLIPNLGVVDFRGESFAAVDIPGLVEGAHEGIGLGHQFLRHVERTRLLVHMIDVSGLSGRDPYQDWQQIEQELALFNASLAQRPQIIVANKMDFPGAQAVYQQLVERLNDRQVLAISAVTGAGITNLLEGIIGKLAQLPKNDQPLITSVLEKEMEHPDDEISVRKENHLYVVDNQNLIKRINRYNLEEDDALLSLQRLLKRWGVDQALIEVGIEEGDTVRIGDFEFVFYPDE